MYHNVTMSLDSFRSILSLLQVDLIKLLPHPAPPARQVRLQLFLQFDGKRGRSGDRKDWHTIPQSIVGWGDAANVFWLHFKEHWSIVTTVTRSTCTENSILNLRRSARNSVHNMSAPGQRDFKFSFALPSKPDMPKPSWYALQRIFC